jgi:hypothetical protein
MKFITIAILASMPLVHAQDPPEVRITVDQGVVLPGLATQIVSAGGSGGNPVTGSPYSAEAITETTQTLSDGSHITHQSSSMIYRDSDGRERRESPQTVMIDDPIAGIHYTLDPSSHHAHATRVPVRIQGGGGRVTIEGGITVTGGIITPRPNRPVLPTPKIDQLGTMTIEGVQAEGTRTTTTIPAGQIGNDRDLEIISERWYSPDLKVAVLTKNSDPRTGETVHRLTRIDRSEPLRSLFGIPADYTISDAPGAIKTPNGAVRLP